MLNSRQGQKMIITTAESPKRHVFVYPLDRLDVIRSHALQLLVLAMAYGVVAKHCEHSIAWVRGAQMSRAVQLVQELESICMAAGPFRLYEAAVEVLDLWVLQADLLPQMVVRGQFLADRAGSLPVELGVAPEERRWGLLTCEHAARIRIQYDIYTFVPISCTTHARVNYTLASSVNATTARLVR
jgi:hypothetical protein